VPSRPSGPVGRLLSGIKSEDLVMPVLTRQSAGYQYPSMDINFAGSVFAPQVITNVPRFEAKQASQGSDLESAPRECPSCVALYQCLHRLCTAIGEELAACRAVCEEAEGAKVKE